MIKLKELLKEFEVNQSLVGQLSKYANSDNIFVSYRDTPQIGINPKSEYNTPSGIYAYPLKCLLRLLGGNKFSFALNKSYVYVIKFNAELLDISELNTNVALAEELFNKIVEKYFLQKNDSLTVAEYRKLFNILNTPSSKQPNEFGINAINFQSSSGKNLSEISVKVLNKLLVRDDFNLKPLVNFEHSFAGISFSELNVGENIKKKLVKNYLFLRTMDNVINKTRSPEKFGFFLWNMTRLLSDKNKNKWRLLFLDLGIHGVVDSGEGIIHSAEPCQVVFFSENPIQIIEIIHNS